MLNCRKLKKGGLNMSQLPFDYSKLRGRIVEKYGSAQRLCEDFGVTNVHFSRKLNGKVSFTQDDIVKLVDLLDIEPSEIGAYFFALKD